MARTVTQKEDGDRTERRRHARKDLSRVPRQGLAKINYRRSANLPSGLKCRVHVASGANEYPFERAVLLAALDRAAGVAIEKRHLEAEPLEVEVRVTGGKGRDRQRVGRQVAVLVIAYGVIFVAQAVCNNTIVAMSKVSPSLVGMMDGRRHKSPRHQCGHQE